MSDDARFDDLVVGYLESGAADADALAALDPAARAVFAEIVADLDGLRHELDAPATWEDPAGSLEDRVVATILAAPVLPATPDELSSSAPSTAAQGLTADDAVGAGAELHDPAPAAGPTVVALADARARRSRSVALAASIVAAAAVVVAIVGFATRPASTGETAGGPTTTPSSAPPTSARVTIGPGVDVPLEPTDLLPGASGRVRLDETESGVWIRLDAAGLPRRDDGAFYQAWVRTPQGLVPIGTFHTGDDVVLWSGVGIADTNAVTVTLEEDDGNQESSGQRVLVATIPHAGSTVPSTSTSSPPATTPR